MSFAELVTASSLITGPRVAWIASWISVSMRLRFVSVWSIRTFFFVYSVHPAAEPLSLEYRQSQRSSLILKWWSRGIFHLVHSLGNLAGFPL